MAANSLVSSDDSVKVTSFPLTPFPLRPTAKFLSQLAALLAKGSCKVQTRTTHTHISSVCGWIRLAKKEASPRFRRFVTGVLPPGPWFSLRDICGGHSGTATGYTWISSVFTCRYHPIIVPHSVIHLSQPVHGTILATDSVVEKFQYL